MFPSRWLPLFLAVLPQLQPAAVAAPPEDRSIVGIRMGAGLDEMRRALARTYPECRIVANPGPYASIDGEGVAACRTGDGAPGHLPTARTAQGGVLDTVVVKMSDASYPDAPSVVAIELLRDYPLPAPGTKPAYALKDVVAFLKSEYGPPDAIDAKERTDHAVKKPFASADKAMSVRLAWGMGAAEALATCGRALGPVVLVVDLQALSSAETRPPAEPYVESARLRFCHAGAARAVTAPGRLDPRRF
jgi:hypothetical protein